LQVSVAVGAYDSGVAESPKAEPKAEQKGSAEPRYDVTDMQEHATARFGVSPHVIAAAASLSDRDTHTLSQMEDLIKRVQKHEVAPDEGTPQAEEESS
jgi:hypothetical protein